MQNWRSRIGRLLLPSLLVVAALLAADARSQPQKQKEIFTPQHVAKFKSVLSVAVSPDGKEVAYLLNVQRDLNVNPDGPSWVELHIVDSAGKSRPLVAGAVNVANAKWTPDGKSISFIDKPGKEKLRALYMIPAAGGEAKKVLEHSTDIQSYSWSPDGKRVAFLATEPRSEEEKQLKEQGFNQEIYEEEWQPVKVWITAIDGKENPKGLDLPGSASELHWSPVDDRLALALAPTPLVDDTYMFRKVRIVDVKTGQLLQQIDNPGKMGELSWSPDGQYLALNAAVDPYDPREGRLWIASSKGIVWHEMTPDYQGHVNGIAWKDKNTAVFAGDEGVWTAVRSVTIGHDAKKNQPVAQSKAVLVPTGGPILSNPSISRDGKAMAFVGHTPKHPPEVYFLGPKDKSPRRLTDHNPWLKDMAFAKQEVVTYQARDGLNIEGVLIRPLNEKKGQRYPLIVNVHGGPESHVPNGWVTAYFYLGQMGAAHGIAQFYPNYRGSTGRGVEFTMLGQKDAAGKEFDDLIDAIDHLAETGLVDKTRVGVTGGSYGGYATAWCSTYYSHRFAAGVMFVGISNSISKMGTTDIPWEMYLVHHRKWLWDDWDYFAKSSPVLHVRKHKTPLLILHGKNDPRVHPSQSLELYRHLKILNQAPVRLILYPGEGHGNRRAASRLDYNMRLQQWMTHYLKGPGGSPPPIQLDYGLTKKSTGQDKTGK